MKFERFVKKTMPYGETLKVDNEAWLSNGVVAMAIPKGSGLFGVESDKKEGLEYILNKCDWGYSYAELSKALLKEADGKAKDIIRVFSDGESEVAISNDNFSLIEKSDCCLIANDADGKGIALLIGKYASVEDFVVDGVIMGIKVQED